MVIKEDNVNGAVEKINISVSNDDSDRYDPEVYASETGHGPFMKENESFVKVDNENAEVSVRNRGSTGGADFVSPDDVSGKVSTIVVCHDDKSVSYCNSGQPQDAVHSTHVADHPFSRGGSRYRYYEGDTQDSVDWAPPGLVSGIFDNANRTRPLYDVAGLNDEWKGLDGGFRIKLSDGPRWVQSINCHVGSTDKSREFFQLIMSHKHIYESGVPNFMGCRIPVHSHLNIPLWRSLLHDYHDYQLVECLEFGFPLGYTRSELPASILKNHSGATLFSSDVDKYFESEIAAGVIAGPFITNPLYIPLTISPINTVPKKDATHRRVISDLSYPPMTSVNDGIPKNMYLDTEINLSFPTVDDLASRIREVGPGALLFKKDLKRAYRQFRVDPGDAHLLGYYWKDGFYIDLALAMGVRSAAFLCQRVTSAIGHIYSKFGFQVSNYIDDLAVVVSSDQANVAYDTLGRLIRDLGVQEAPEKACRPSTEMEFLGVQFSVTEMSMSVTPDRLNEILQLVDEWLNKSRATKRQLQSLIGKLQFVAKCVRAGRIFISRLLHILPSLKKQHHHFHVNKQFKKDLLWWKLFIRSYNGVSLIPDMNWSAPDALLSTDACLSSFGGWSGTQYISSKFPDHILLENNHINVLELMAVMIALKVWAPSVRNRRIQILCDNSASVTVLNSGRTKDPKMLAILREVAFICAQYNCQIRASHIIGIDNRLADQLSRAPIDRKARSHLNNLIDNNWCEIEIDDVWFNLSNDW
jgi:hypothetical protein